jgi:hypothetical protein
VPARNFWPRVEEAVNAQAVEDRLKLSPAERRHIVHAVVEDLSNTRKSNNTNVIGELNIFSSLF